MKKILVFLICLSSFAYADRDFSLSDKRGDFSAVLLSSYFQSSLMNADGSSATFKGYLLGPQLEIKLWNFEPGDLRVFCSYLFGEGKGLSGDKLRRDENFFGVKMYPNTNIFVGAGMGHSNNRLSRDGTNTLTLTSAITGFGTGYEARLGEAFFVALNAWYKSGPIKQSENTSLNYSSFVGGFEVQLQMIWSPSSGFIGK